MLGARLAHPPLESSPEVSKTSPAHPVVAVLRTVSFVQHARTVLDHELGPTECAVIVVPTLTIARIRAPEERDALQVSILAPKPPVVLVHDESGRLTDRALAAGDPLAVARVMDERPVPARARHNGFI